MFLEALNNNVPTYILINCQLLREGFRASQIVRITNFVVVSSVGIMRVDCINCIMKYGETFYGCFTALKVFFTLLQCIT